MLSLPHIHPPPLPSLLVPPQTQTAQSSSNTNDPPSHLLQQQQQQQQQRHNAQHQPPVRTRLSTLALEERLLATRKQNIRRFGAGWLRPPGISKTLQGLEDERAEREEAEALRQRELALEEARMAQEAMEGPDVEFAEGDPEQERDLDEEVPDMDEEGTWSDEEEEEADVWDDDDEVDLDAGEIEGLEGAEGGEGDYGSPVRQPPPSRATINGGATGGGGRAVFVTPSGSFQTPTVRLPARTPDGPITPNGYGGVGRDLDDDVPEAGTYEHSDTELEDASTDDGWMEPVTASTQIRSPPHGGDRLVSGVQMRATSVGQTGGHGQGYRTPGNANESWIGGSSSINGAPGFGNMHGGSIFGSSPLASTQVPDRGPMSGGSARTGTTGRRGTGRRGYGREN